jgi:EAL domain-containing protein (putative c-di-GMP-specific phosphodiesterase class I)
MAEKSSVQVIAITVLGFRTINDLYGYSNGDNTLKTLALRLQRWPGISARLAGGEILYITHETLNQEQLETLKHILEQPVESNLIAIPVKVAMAIINCPVDASTSEELFRKMNIVTDEAIHTGEWCVSYRTELEDKYTRRLSITTELKRALASQQDELSMVYQPKVDLASMKVSSMEALIRWNNSLLGFVPPDEFITIAEQAGLIEQVTTWVMQQTITDLAYFREKGYDFTVAMNLSTQDIQNKTLLKKLVAKLNEKGLSPEALELEITESDLVADASLAIENLSELTARGFHFAIDDFGTGYSSLAYLKNLPVKTIKIDKSFILSLASDENDQQIVHTVLRLASAFNLKVVAEGVEDQASLEILREWGCDVVQGYFISRPLKLNDLESWLQNTPYGA